MGVLTYARPRVAAPAGRNAAAAFALGALAVGALSAANGGYFASSWGWAIVAAAAATAWAVSLGEPLRLTRTETVFLTALGGLAAWFPLSSLWGRPAAALDEAARALVYVAVVACALVVVRRETAGALLGGLLAGASGVALYALGTRLFPDRIGTFDPVATYRLSTPIGYWNALGLLAAVALLIALALVASAESWRRAALAAAPAPVLASVVYFTFSRGSWIALAVGLVVAVALSTARVRVTIAAAALCAPSALAVLLASRADALTHQGAAVSAAADDGRRLALWIVLLAAAAALLGALATRSLRVTDAMERAYAWALAAAAVVAVVVTMAAAGGPIRSVERAWAAFTAAPTANQADLRKRLFNFSSNGRVDLWRAALDQFSANPVVGAGGGSFEAYWLRNRDAPMKVRDAHSLYLESLAELGVIGFAVLVVALGTPLVVGIRRRNLVTAAYVAFLVHAGVDWDWEITSVTLLGLLTGVAILVEARGDDVPLGRRARGALLGGAGLVGALGFVFLVGNMFLSRAAAAADGGRFTQAAKHARTASSWLPWSTEPWRRLGEAELAQGRPAQARAAFERAIEKDGTDWSLWLDLARAGDRRALAEAERLNPLSPEIAEFRNESGGISIGVGP